jgi:2-dehydro-3-deoxyphosphogluconate aldolase/(4S)-4-hydroxy-2-oxoglutarate aldolase
VTTPPNAATASVAADRVTSVVDTGLLAIVRFAEGGDIEGVVRVLAEAGVGAEVTMDTPRALEIVAHAAATRRTLGVGTVTTAAQVADAARAGATFVVSPGLLPDVVNAAFDHGLEPVPGVYTATEVLAAARLGVRTMKLFPASGGGPRYLAALMGPFRTTAFVPTGGVQLEDVEAYFAAGAAAVALGTGLVGRYAPRTAEDLALIAERARQARTLVDKVLAARSARAAGVQPAASSSGGNR